MSITNNSSFFTHYHSLIHTDTQNDMKRNGRIKTSMLFWVINNAISCAGMSTENYASSAIFFFSFYYSERKIEVLHAIDKYDIQSTVVLNNYYFYVLRSLVWMTPAHSKWVVLNPFLAYGDVINVISYCNYYGKRISWVTSR